MEHRLIQGGEQYLPFARSRIKALRATGLKYASQRFIMPSGERVRVQITGEHEYIEISGSGGDLTMDSGVVEVFAIAALNPQRFDAGALYELGAALPYNSGFVAVEGETYRAKPLGTPPTSAGQLAGTIARGNGYFQGKIYPTQSFLPGQITNPSDITATIPDPADALLHEKKVMAVICPASIFTGRCRMYVQAMYGRALRTRGAESLALQLESSVPPSLRVPAYRVTEEFAPYVVLDTSCGVLLEGTTLRHYLVKPVGGQFKFYHLKGTATAEAMRKYLNPEEDPEMSNTDREHLEAYILAHSLPDTRYAMTGTGEYSFGNYSMGYGWHWNWEGNRADIVINNVFIQDSVNNGMESTHYRMVVRAVLQPPPPSGSTSPTPFAFETPVTIVEGPTRWAVYRPFWTIVEPNFAAGILEKTTPQLSNVFECSAPFYAFYDRNDLKVCRVDVTLTLGDGASVVEDFVYGTTAHTTGTREGSRTEYSLSGSYYSAVFSCGDTSTDPLPFAQNKPFSNKIAVLNKVLRGDFFDPGSGSFSYASRDYQVSENDGTGARVDTIVGWLLKQDHGAYMTYDIYTGSGHEEINGKAQVIVPFNDAESIFIRAITERDNVYPARGHYQMLSSQHVLKSVIGRAYSPYGEDQVTAQHAVSVGSFAASGPTLVSYVVDVDGISTEQIYLLEKLIGHGAPKTATFDNIAQFENNSVDYVESTYSVLASFASVGGTNPITISPDHITAEGLFGTEVAIPVIVGWV